MKDPWGGSLTAAPTPAGPARRGRPRRLAYPPPARPSGLSLIAYRLLFIAYCRYAAEDLVHTIVTAPRWTA